MGYALVFVVLILFYVPTLSAMALTGMKSLVCSLRKREIVAICLLSIVFLATIMALMARERYIYFWDFGAYWYKTLQFQNTLSSSAMDILRNLIYSVETADYNNIVCAIIALPLKLFGSSYFAFVLLNVAMFYIPNAFFMAFVFCKVLEKHSLAEVRIVWVYGYTLLFSVALFPVLAGYVDIVGMLPLTSSFLLVIDREFEQVDIAKDICLGASLLWVMLLRRYYAYAVVGGAVFAFFYWFTYGATFKKPFFRLKNKIIDMLLSIAVPVIVLVTVFPNYIIRSLLNNHSSAYSAYKTAGLVGEWIKFARYFGIFFIALMIVGVLYGIWRKAGRLTVGLLLNLAVTCTLFFRIQNMGQHHYYIAVFPMCCLIFLGVYALLSVCTKEAFLAWGVRSLIVFVIVGNFLMSIGIGTSYKSALWVERTYVPRVRSDFEALRDLEKCLEDLSDEGFHRVYCTASSVIFNNSIIYNLNAPDKNPKISWAGVSHVDLRDGFNTQFFESDIIVACNPPQSHLQHGQEVVLRLNEVMMTENIFSRNYEIRNEYILDRGVHAVVFVKKEPLERSEIEYIQDIFEGLYPGYPELFSERINTYLNEKY